MVRMLPSDIGCLNLFPTAFPCLIGGVSIHQLQPNLQPLSAFQHSRSLAPFPYRRFCQEGRHGQSQAPHVGATVKIPLSVGLPQGCQQRRLNSYKVILRALPTLLLPHHTVATLIHTGFCRFHSFPRTSTPYILNTKRKYSNQQSRCASPLPPLHSPPASPPPPTMATAIPLL
jgi:hypothetical protein